MAKADVVKQVAMLKAAYPRDTIPAETLGVYAVKLADIEPQLLAAAVNRLIEEAKFFPTIAEVRRMAARLAGLLPPAPAEALAMVRRADVSRPVYRRDGSLAYTEHEWDWSGMSRAEQEFCELVIARVGDPVNAATDEKHFGWDQGFQKVAELAGETITRAALANLATARLAPPDTGRKAIASRAENPTPAEAATILKRLTPGTADAE